MSICTDDDVHHADDLLPLVRFKAFLFTGEDKSERGLFYTPPKNPEQDLSDSFEKYKSLDLTLTRLVSKGEGAEAARVLQEVATANRSPRRNALLFALAKLMAVREPPTVAAAARGIVNKIVREDSPDDMLALYFYYMKCRKILKAKGKGGRGIRRLLNAWFNDRTSQDLLRVPSKQGITMKDIILLGHLKGNDQEHKVLISYFLFGLKQTQDKFDTDDLDAKASACLAYIERADSLRRSGADSERALQLVKDHYFDISNIPSELYSNPEIWSVCVSRMNLSDMICYMKTMASRGHLTNPESICVKIICRELANISAIGPSKLQPIDAFKCFKNAQSFWKPPKPKIPEASKRRKLKPAAAETVCDEILKALEKLAYLCYQNLRPLSKSILVIVDNRPSMLVDNCWRMHNLTPLDAAAVIVLSLANAEGAEVTLGVFGKEKESSVQTVAFLKDDAVETLKAKLMETEVGLLDLIRPVDWALKEKRRFDAIVCLTGSHTYCDKDKLGRKLKSYREAVENKTRYVFHASGTRDASMSRKNDPLMFEAVGFDVHMPKLIASFIDEEF